MSVATKLLERFESMFAEHVQMGRAPGSIRCRRSCPRFPHRLLDLLRRTSSRAQTGSVPSSAFFRIQMRHHRLDWTPKEKRPRDVRESFESDLHGGGGDGLELKKEPLVDGTPSDHQNGGPKDLHVSLVTAATTSQQDLRGDRRLTEDHVVGVAAQEICDQCRADTTLMEDEGRWVNNLSSWSSFGQRNFLLQGTQRCMLCVAPATVGDGEEIFEHRCAVRRSRVLLEIQSTKSESWILAE
jgi:hypothetical protein